MGSANMLVISLHGRPGGRSVAFLYGRAARQTVAGFYACRAPCARGRCTLVAGGMMAANIIAPRMSGRRGGPRAAQNTRLVARGATAMVSVGQNRSAEVSGAFCTLSSSTCPPVSVGQRA